MSILQIKILRLKEINWYKIILLLRDRFKPSLNSVYAEEVRRYFLSIYVPGHILGSCVQSEFLFYLCVCVCVCVTESYPTLCDPSVHARLLCPWGSLSKNTEVGYQFLLQRIVPDQGSNPCLLHWQADSLPLSHQESPCFI